MLYNNQNIHIEGQEALELIKKLDKIIVSLGKIKTYHSDPRNNKTNEEKDKAIASYVIENNVAKELAYIRGFLSSKFDLSLGEDDMDDVERFCDNNEYWSPKKKKNSKNATIDSWHKNQIPVLKTAIINEFDVLYHLLLKKKQHIYGYSIILDDDCLTAYSMASTIESLKKIHKNREWSAEEWCLGIDDDDVSFGIGAFTDVMINFYNEHIAPQFKNGFDYAPIREKNLHLFSESMRLAKKDLIKKYGNEIQEMAFFLTIPGEPQVTKESALHINQPTSQKVNELIENLWI